MAKKISINTKSIDFKAGYERGVLAGAGGITKTTIDTYKSIKVRIY